MTRTIEEIGETIRSAIQEAYELTAQEGEDPALKAPSVTGWMVSAAITGFNEDGEISEDGHVAFDGPFRLALGCALDGLDYLRGLQADDR